MGEIKEERVVQNVRDETFTEDVDYDPPRPLRFFIDNLFRRVLAHLVGYTGRTSVRLRCTSAGELKVATVGAGYEYNDTKSGNAPNTYGAAIQFDKTVSRVDIWIWDNAAIFKRTSDGLVWNDEIEIPANTTFHFDASTHSFNIKNKTAGSVARYQVVGWW
jgi:hypothetical protein